MQDMQEMSNKIFTKNGEVKAVSINLDNPELSEEERLSVLKSFADNLLQICQGSFNGIKMREVRTCLDNIPDTENKEVVLLVGTTGSGKSTIVNYLMGSKLELTINEFGEQQVNVAPGYKEYAKIGHTMNAETQWPKIDLEQAFKYAYCDCPGFDDNRGGQQLMLNSINMKKAINSSKTIKAVIVVIDYKTLEVNKGNSFRKVLQTISCLLDQPEKNENSIYFVFNKVPENKDQKFIINKLKNIKQGLDYIEVELKNDKELQDLNRMICFLLNNPANILIVNPLDNGQCRDQLKKLINQSFPIPQNTFRSTESEVTEMKIKEYAESLIEIGLQIGSYLFYQERYINDYLLGIAKCRQELDSASKLREDNKKQKDNLELQNQIDIQKWQAEQKDIMKKMEENTKTKEEYKWDIDMYKEEIDKYQHVINNCECKKCIEYHENEESKSHLSENCTYRKKDPYEELRECKNEIQVLEKKIVVLDDHNKQLARNDEEIRKLKIDLEIHNSKLFQGVSDQSVILNQKILEITLRIMELERKLELSKKRFETVKKMYLEIDEDGYDENLIPPVLKKPAFFNTLIRLALLLRLDKSSNLISAFLSQYQKLNPAGYKFAIDSFFLKEVANVISVAPSFLLFPPNILTEVKTIVPNISSEDITELVQISNQLKI